MFQMVEFPCSSTRLSPWPGSFLRWRRETEATRCNDLWWSSSSSAMTWTAFSWPWNRHWGKPFAVCLHSRYLSLFKLCVSYISLYFLPLHIFLSNTWIFVPGSNWNDRHLHLITLATGEGLSVGSPRVLKCWFLITVTWIFVRNRIVSFIL